MTFDPQVGLFLIFAMAAAAAIATTTAVALGAIRDARRRRSTPDVTLTRLVFSLVPLLLVIVLVLLSVPGWTRPVALHADAPSTSSGDELRWVLGHGR